MSLISFFAFFTLKVNGANSKNSSIAIDIHSFNEANYSQNLNHATVPGVQLEIIRDILLDQGNPNSDIEVRLAKLTEILTSPIPSATPNPLQITPSPKVSPTNNPLFSITATTNIENTATTITTPTSNPQTSTSTPTRLTTSTSTITATELPAVTYTPTIIIASKTPTNQPTNTSTLRPTNTRTASATNTITSPTNTPTALSTNTPIALPTDTPTNQPTNTPTITPTFQSSNTPTSQFTNTPTAQSTNTPTTQFTNTPTAQSTNTPTIQNTVTETTQPTASPTTQRTNTPTVQPTSTLTSSPTFTPTPLPTNTPTSEPSCSLPFPFSENNSPPPNGFINAMSPAHNEMNVSLELTSISVYYNQPMESGTLGHGVQRTSNYQLRNLTDPLNPVPMNITFVDYDPATYIAKVYFDATPENGWVPQSTFEFISKSAIYNICGDDQGVVVEINFSTGASATIGSKESSIEFFKAPTIGIFKSLFLAK